MNEVKKKIKSVQTYLSNNELESVRFKGVDWFSWITGGGNSVVIFTAESGIAEVLITQKKAWVITNNIERERLVQEELPVDFELISFPWQKTHFPDEFARSKTVASQTISDKPKHGELPLPEDFLLLRLVLSEEEIQRYQLIGEAAAEAMTEAICLAEPDWTEHQLAGEGAKALWSRGLDPTLVLVGSEKRVQKFRHPIATEDFLGDYAMMVFCARSCGLYANLTRFIFFREPRDEEMARFEKVAKIEAAAFNSSKPGTKLTSVYEDIKKAYAENGVPEEINYHHQGGLTGFLSREITATPNLENDVVLQRSMAVAWNPSLPGAKIEDTALITENGCEILTVDPLWPTFELNGRERPQVWVKK